jgi:hypothetical protein
MHHEIAMAETDGRISRSGQTSVFVMVDNTDTIFQGRIFINDFVENVNARIGTTVIHKHTFKVLICLFKHTTGTPLNKILDLIDGY